MTIFDFHSDFITNNCGQKLLKEYVLKQNKIVAAVFRGNRELKKAMHLADLINNSNKEKIFLAFEDIGYEEDGAIEKIIAKKPYFASLTWNNKNLLAVGCKEKGKLKEKGREAVEKLNDAKIAVDVAHLNKEGILEVCERAKYVVDSHTCFSEVNEHYRNIDCESIKSIIAKKGIIGLTLYSPFLTSKYECSSNDVFLHIDWFCQKFGYENLSIGTDFFGAEDFPNDLKDYQSFENLLLTLDKHGYNANVIKRIMFENLNEYVSQLNNQRQ